MELELWVDKSFNILLCASDGWIHSTSDQINILARAAA